MNSDRLSSDRLSGDRLDGGSVAQYRLIDFGDGRKLERLGDLVLDRPCPAAIGIKRALPRQWDAANAIFRDSGDGATWEISHPWPDSLRPDSQRPDSLRVDCGGFQMPCYPTPFGHIGLFPEQAPNWRWIEQFANRLLGCGQAAGVRVLNLFAYTGASTIAAAGCMRNHSEGGVSEVVHVDAARPNVQAAKQAVEINDLNKVTIRFMVDDARKFVEREKRRGRCYDLIVLDPPAYGHGGRGGAWRIERDLWVLLENCLEIASPERGGILITGHTEGFGPREIGGWLKRSLGKQCQMQRGRSTLPDQSGRNLDAGFYVRAQWGMDR
jgi:23S rRNA (cytosine1962-C5)-methyltransferase